MASNRLWKTCLIASACCILAARAQPLERKYAASDGAVIITSEPQNRRSSSSSNNNDGISAPEADFDVMHLDDGLTDEERARLDIEDLERSSDVESDAEVEPQQQQQDYGKVVKSLTGSTLDKQQRKKLYRNQQLQQQQLVDSYAF